MFKHCYAKISLKAVHLRVFVQITLMCIDVDDVMWIAMACGYASNGMYLHNNPRNGVSKSWPIPCINTISGVGAECQHPAQDSAMRIMPVSATHRSEKFSGKKYHEIQERRERGTHLGVLLHAAPGQSTCL
jgi:hypothetical protein